MRSVLVLSNGFDTYSSTVCPIKIIYSSPSIPPGKLRELEGQIQLNASKVMCVIKSSFCAFKEIFVNNFMHVNKKSGNLHMLAMLSSSVNSVSVDLFWK